MFVHDIRKSRTSIKSTTTSQKKQKNVIASKRQHPSSSSSSSVESKRDPKSSSPTARTRTRTKPKKGIRPSLSDQLKSIGENASKLTSQLRNRAGMMDSQQAILRSPSRDFRVGKLRSRYPSPVEFFEDCLKFTFHHPYERKVINMVMYYSDMALVSVQRLRREFSFKVHKKLEHFGKDYDANDRQHFITILFNSDSDVNRLRKDVLPNIFRICKSIK